MTTNQQIDKIIGVLYEYQVKQKSDWTQLPAYQVLCSALFAEIPNLTDRHYHNLLYMLVSKQLIDIHAGNLREAFDQPINLKPEVIVWYEQFRSYHEYLDYLEQKSQPKAFREDYEEDIDLEQEKRKSGWAKIPVWARIILLIAAIIGLVILVMGSGKE